VSQVRSQRGGGGEGSYRVGPTVQVEGIERGSHYGHIARDKNIVKGRQK
jgi:hypothetical protein